MIEENSDHKDIQEKCQVGEILSSESIHVSWPREAIYQSLFRDTEGKCPC